jgi:hypothetical protein
MFTPKRAIVIRPAHYNDLVDLSFVWPPSSSSGTALKLIPQCTKFRNYFEVNMVWEEVEISRLVAVFRYVLWAKRMDEVGSSTEIRNSNLQKIKFYTRNIYL